MAVHMKSIPTLRGQVESRFIAMFEDILLRRVFHGSILEGDFLFLIVICLYLQELNQLNLMRYV